MKASGTKRWKLKHDKLLLSFAFNFNLRRYIVDLVNRDYEKFLSLSTDLVDVESAVGTHGLCSPRYRMPSSSRHGGLKYVGLADSARHVTRCHSAQETRV
jgi:hypothetical protein